MRLFVAAAILITAHAATLGSNKCTWGPSYWCSSLDAATSCQAFTHCLDSVWKHQLLAVKETDECLFSEKLVGTIRDVLASKNEKDETAYLIGSMCTAVKDETFRKECKYTVTKFLPEILQLVNSTTEAISVAAVMGLCKPLDDSDNELSEQDSNYIPATDDSVCKDCHVFVSEIGTIFTSQLGSEEKFEMEMEEIICSGLGGLQPACNAALKLVLPKMFKFIADYEHRHDICQMNTFCNKKPKLEYLMEVFGKQFHGVIHDLLRSLQDEHDAPSCHECGKVVSSALAFEKDYAFRESVEHSLEFLCSHTSLGEEKCRLLSERLVPTKLISMATHGVDVKKVCQSVIRCKDEDYLSEEDVEVAPSVLPVEVLPGPSAVCSQCQQFFGDVSRVLQSTIFVPEMTDLAKKTVCQHAGKFTSQCRAMLDRIMPSVLKSLGKSETSESVCSRMALCPAEFSSDKFDFVKIVSAALKKSPLVDVECDACQDIVQEARDAARNPDVQKGVVDLFNGICGKLGQEADQCKELVQQYSQQLFELIVSEMEPTVVCEILFSCTKPEESMPAPDSAYEPEPEFTVPDEVILALDQEEPPTPSYSLVYKKSKKNSAAYANQQKPALKKKYKKNTTAQDDQIGPVLKKSKKDSAVYERKMYDLGVREGESPACAICQLIMEYIDQVVAENSTEQEVEKGLKDVCNLLPSSVKQVCEQFIAEYTPSIIELLVQKLDPKAICAELKVCDGMELKHADNAYKAEQEEDEYDVEKRVESPAEKPTCTLCEIVMGIVITQVGENRSEADIQKTLDDVCKLLPSEIKEECLSFVNEYSRFVVQMILQDLEPNEICARLGLCDKTQQTVVELPVTKFDQEKADDTECEVCKIVISELNNILGENRTEEALIHAVEIVCDVVSGDLRLQCKSEVENYGPAVLDLLRHMDDPDQICRALNLCTSKDIINSSGQKTKNDQSEGDICILCETIANYAQEAVKEQSTVVEVVKVLEDACTLLPESIRADCDTLVKEYAPLILERLAEKDNPLEICQDLKLCPKNLGQKETPMLGVDACTFGPAFWCANIDNARKCGMEKDCIEKYGMKIKPQ